MAFVVIDTLHAISRFPNICLCAAVLVLAQQDIECRARALFHLAHHLKLRLGEHYHLADLVADEHGTNPVWVASTQMRCYNLTSCHIIYCFFTQWNRPAV